ncbi:MAG TPA: DUF4886 domain-containing protein [Clostridiaceae bacterium]|nr:DUF4886 domain-containing protein [Clostridiaceae bacterium]
MKVLAIGNSFSQDATYFLHDISVAAGEAMHVVNLFIGGCPLERHWQNIESGEQAYEYQENGVVTGKYVSIQEMLESKKWDYIVTQQSSHDSGWENTYEPFLGLITDYLKRQAPESEFMLQKTWAYDINSTHQNFMRYNRSQEEMYERLSKCYADMAEKYGLSLIPCGDVIQNLRKLELFDLRKGGRSLCRDGYHMHFIYGRYALAYTWARVLLGRSLEHISYMPYSDLLPDVAPDPNIIKLIQTTIEETVRMLGHTN